MITSPVLVLGYGFAFDKLRHRWLSLSKPGGALRGYPPSSSKDFDFKDFDFDFDFDFKTLQKGV
jgi:hypothetical protein